MTFKTLPQAYEQDVFENHVPFTINGIYYELVQIGDIQGQTVELLLPFNDSIAAVSAGLSCGASTKEVTSPTTSGPISHCEAVVGLRLTEYNDRRLTAQLGLNITLLSPSNYISTLTLGYPDADIQAPRLISQSHVITEEDVKRYQSLAEAHLEASLKDLLDDLPGLNQSNNDSPTGSLSGPLDLENQQHEKCFARLHRLLEHFAAGAEKALKSTFEAVHIELSQVSFSTTSSESTEQDIMVTSTNNDTAPQGSEKSQYKKLDQANPLVLVLEIIAGAIGLTALVKFIKRRCCSLRRKVERLADREERKAAQAYRRAARKEAVRQRWEAVRSLFRRPGRKGNDEEKRALILAAAEEEGLMNEKNDTQDELVAFQHAHGIVSRMVRSGRQFWLDPIITPSSSKVVTDTRSRASSLPSYHSEALPDYTSSPGSSHEVSNRFRPESPISSRASTADTPDSSIPDLSPRNSSETLRSDFDKASA